MTNKDIVAIVGDALIDTTCKRKDCLQRNQYADCFLIYTESCKYYTKKIPIEKLRSMSEGIR